MFQFIIVFANIFVLPKYQMVVGYYGCTLVFYLSICRLLYFHQSFCYMSDYKMSKYQWIFMKLGRCFDIFEIWFGITNGQFLAHLSYAQDEL